MALRIVNCDIENTSKKFEVLLTWSVVGFRILTAMGKNQFLSLSVNIVMLLVNQTKKKKNKTTNKSQQREVLYLCCFTEIVVNTVLLENGTV